MSSLMEDSQTLSTSALNLLTHVALVEVYEENLLHTEWTVEWTFYACRIL